MSRLTDTFFGVNREPRVTRDPWADQTPASLLEQFEAGLARAVHEMNNPRPPCGHPDNPHLVPPRGPLVCVNCGWIGDKALTDRLVAAMLAESARQDAAEKAAKP